PVPLVREHRLYQADWLMRFYGFRLEDIATGNDGNLSLDFDPKLVAAVRNRDKFPVEINRAPLETLLKVPGIGPKTAISVMSKLSLAVLQGAIAAGDVALLSKCPGIGRKTAERLVIELRDKVTGSAVSLLTPPAGGKAATIEENKVRDAVMALVALGYKAADADKSVRQAWVALGANASTEALIKRALG
ncbi:MAG: Holliday junction branch migration protein RuvA, partial [Candidatus Didemnitutus sp.]|nr:Holliday junction branch migration protein RuvA [Candidatus Didemnitutus sp.]